MTLNLSWEKWFQEQYRDRGGLFNYLYQQLCYQRPFYEMIKKHLPPPRTILDIGCGTGLLPITFGCFGYEVLGVDIDEAMIREAEKIREIFEPLLQVDVSFRAMDAFNLQFPDKNFDVALNVGMIEHFSWKDQIRLLGEQKRVAQNVAIYVPTRRQKENAPSDVYTFPHTPRSLRSLCNSLGLRIIEQINFGIDPGWLSLHIKRWMLPKFYARFLQERYALSTACLCH